MTVKITLTTAEADAGPFDLYSNLDGYTTPFATDITKDQLVAGYTTDQVPDYTVTIRVKCKGTCINSIDISLSRNINMFTLSKADTCELACGEFATARSIDFFNLTN